MVFFFYWHFRKCKATKKLVSWYDEWCVFYKGYWRWAKIFLLHLFHVLFSPLLQFLFHHILHTQSFRSARRTVQSFPPFNSFRPSITFPSFSRPALRKIKTKWTSFTLNNCRETFWQNRWSSKLLSSPIISLLSTYIDRYFYKDKKL